MRKRKGYGLVSNFEVRKRNGYGFDSNFEVRKRKGYGSIKKSHGRVRGRVRVS